MTTIAKKVFPIILVLALFSLAIFSIISSVNKIREEQESLNEEVQEIVVEEKQEKRNLELSGMDERSNINVDQWVLYQNDLLGFEFDYPEQDLILFSDQDKVQLIGNCDLASNQDSVHEQDCETKSKLTLWVVNDKPIDFIKRTEERCRNEDEQCIQFSPFVDQILLDGHEGLKVQAVTENRNGSLDNSQYIFVSRQGNKQNETYVISYDGNNDVYPRIISTFRFIPEQN